MTNVLTKLKKEFEDELEHILQYWMQNAVDLLDGGFFGKIDGLGKVIERSPKGVVLNCRILWSFSAAYIYSQEKAHLIHAQRAYDYLIMHFLDRENNGVIWEVDHKGNQLDGRKQIYAQAFAIYGFSAFYIASGQEESLQNAKQLFECIEKYSFDDVNSGYLECLTQDWKPISDMRLSQKDQNYPMTMNTHLHILEAYTSLYKVWKHKHLQDQLHTLIRIFLDRIIDRKRTHFQLFFDQDWSVQSNINSFGHNIEGAWLLTEAAELLGDHDLLTEAEDVAISLTNATIKDGMDDDGSLFYEFDYKRNHLDADKHWWPQAEGLIGLTNAYQITANDLHLGKANELWEFIKNRMLDKKNGEWYWKVDRAGVPYMAEDKVGFWKCPYHNSRACLEMIRRINLLIN